jgi:predicted DNA-binding transcriptional regulator AlpA
MSLDIHAVQTAKAVGLSPLPSEMEALVPSKDAPAYLGLAEQTLARWRSEGHGPPYVKLGKKVYYRVGDLRSWIDGQGVTPAPARE